MAVGRLKYSSFVADSNLKYVLYPENGRQSDRIEFGVKADSGTIFVKEQLDYETKKSYSLVLMVTDGKHDARTTISITITDVNDNAPKFEMDKYETTVREEDKRVPIKLFTVAATDADSDATSKDIVYRLEGQGVGEFFAVDERRGVITAVKPLDRDPPKGVPSYKFMVQAIDDGGRGRIGYADVQVNLEDINDNAPFFQSDLVGYVEENREPGGMYGICRTARK